MRVSPLLLFASAIFQTLTPEIMETVPFTVLDHMSYACGIGWLTSPTLADVATVHAVHHNIDPTDQ